MERLFHSNRLLGWGATGTTDQLIEGTNVLYVDGQTASSLTIGSTGNSSGTGTRGCISGIQIVNTYDGRQNCRHA